MHNKIGPSFKQTKNYGEEKETLTYTQFECLHNLTKTEQDIQKIIRKGTLDERTHGKRERISDQNSGWITNNWTGIERKLYEEVNNNNKKNF